MTHSGLFIGSCCKKHILLILTSPALSHMLFVLSHQSFTFVLSSLDRFGTHLLLYGHRISSLGASSRVRFRDSRPMFSTNICFDPVVRRFVLLRLLEREMILGSYDTTGDMLLLPYRAGFYLGSQGVFVLQVAHNDQQGVEVRFSLLLTLSCADLGVSLAQEFLNLFNNSRP